MHRFGHTEAIVIISVNREIRGLCEISNAQFLHYSINSLKSSFIFIDSLNTFQTATIVNSDRHRDEVSYSFGKPFSSHLFLFCEHFHQSYNGSDAAERHKKKLVLKVKRPIFIFPMMITNFEIIRVLLWNDNDGHAMRALTTLNNRQRTLVNMNFH